MAGMLGQAAAAGAQPQAQAGGGEVPPEIAAAMQAQQTQQQGAPQPGPEGAPPPGLEEPAPPPGPGTAAEAPDISNIEEQATPAEQKEYERALGALSKVLYQSEETSNSVLGQLHPSDKVGSIVKTSLLLLNQLDDKLDMDEVIIPEMTMEIVSRVTELAEAQNPEMALSEKEQQAALGAAWEGVMETYGVDEADVQGVSTGIDESQLSALQQQHQAALSG